MINNKTLAIIANLGFQLLYIQDTLYVFDKWIPAGKETKKHVLEGRDITAFATLQSQNPTDDIRTLTVQLQTIIEKEQKQRREFHESIVWQAWLI